MSYITREDLEQRFGSDEIAQLLDDDASDTEESPETDTLTPAITDAESIVDGYVGTRYAVPLDPVPGLVKNWCSDIARFKLWDEKAPEEVRQRYEDAIAALKDLARGLINLPVAVDVPISGAEGITSYSNCRLFTECTLKDF